MKKQRNLKNHPTLETNNSLKRWSILFEVDNDTHKWLVDISIKADKSQGKILNYLLKQAQKQPISIYVDEFIKHDKEQQRKDLIIKQEAIKEQLALLEKALS